MITKRIEELEKECKAMEGYAYEEVCQAKLNLLKELRAEIEKEIDNLTFKTIYRGDEGTNCFIEVVRVDKIKQKLIGTKEEKLTK